MNKWIDISQPLTNDIAHWPGDTAFSYSLSYSKKDTGSVNIGQITTSLHTGTHVDAPFHFDSDAKTIEQLNINTFVGKARIIDVSHDSIITDETLKAFSWDNISRVLLRTSLPNKPWRFPKKIPKLDRSIAPFLSKQGVKLIGIDMPSVDPIDSKSLDVHHTLNQHDIQILENIMLEHVDDGDYELIALPLPIHGADGSPVRAIIRKLSEKRTIHEKR